MKADDLPINTPCDESWSAMRGGPSRRFCDVCARDVHDLSQMTERDARTLLAGASERLCVRYAIGHDGAIRFQPEASAAPPPPTNLVQLRTPTRDRPAAIARAAAAAVVLAACTPHHHDEEPPCAEPEIVQELGQGGVEGIMEPPPPPPPPPIVQGGIGPELEPPPPPPPPPIVEDPPAVMGQVAEVKMGDVAGPEIPPPPPPPPDRDHVKMGKIAYDPELHADPVEDVPCDSPPPPPPAPHDGPRRY
ncbi:MAG: hypothetical protein H6710_14095 [Myxococcales bacterium]|nr:hypothetical protein [Myxococcales bacterium]MCB9705041.1 hypothetical protein [Myxococcales bacterium]